jgi:S-adenosylmethionine-diacylglycerol 3-amino-3-carboxypropyl transferase
LNQCGLIDQKLGRAARLFLPLLLGPRRLAAMFEQPDLASQRRFYREQWDNWRWKLLFRWALSRPVLRLLFGSRFLETLPPDFPRLMKQQVDTTFLEFPIAENGYLWQTFRGVYPPAEAGLPLYLQSQKHPIVRAGLSRLTLACADAAAWLAAQPAASISFFALSNILEVTTPDYTAHLARAIRHTARPGALVCLRSIFPPGSNDLCRHEETLRLDKTLSAELDRIDRSPFCRFIQVLRVSG